MRTKLTSYQIRTLIAEVRKREKLYQRSKHSYKDIKRVLWREVCKEVYPGWKDLKRKAQTEKVDQIKKEWDGLRNHAKREKSPYYNQLLFLRGTIIKEDLALTSVTDTHLEHLNAMSSILDNVQNAGGTITASQLQSLISLMSKIRTHLNRTKSRIDESEQGSSRKDNLNYRKVGEQQFTNDSRESDHNQIKDNKNNNQIAGSSEQGSFYLITTTAHNENSVYKYLTKRLPNDWFVVNKQLESLSVGGPHYFRVFTSFQVVKYLLGEQYFWPGDMNAVLWHKLNDGSRKKYY